VLRLTIPTSSDGVEVVRELAGRRRSQAIASAATTPAQPHPQRGRRNTATPARAGSSTQMLSQNRVRASVDEGVGLPGMSGSSSRSTPPSPVGERPSAGPSWPRIRVGFGRGSALRRRLFHFELLVAGSSEAAGTQDGHILDDEPEMVKASPVCGRGGSRRSVLSVRAF
jgi:hypothetical protein